MAAFPSTPLRIFLFDTPRTNCHAFYRCFSAHPQLAWMRFFHGFAAAGAYGPERLQLRTKHGDAFERTQMVWGTEYPEANSRTYESSVREMREVIDQVEKEGKIFFGKEHVNFCTQQDIILATIRRGPNDPLPSITSNPTYIPSDILATLTPIILFRHPALSVPSNYRVTHPEAVAGLDPDDEDFEIWTTYRWTQYLHDYFLSIGRTPIVVEAQDFIYETKATLTKLCQELRIDEEGWVDGWEALPREKWPDHAVGNAMTGDVMLSEGIQRRGVEPAEKSLDIEVEFGKWRTAWGERVALGIRRRVEAEMPTYEYLRSVKLRP